MPLLDMPLEQLREYTGINPRPDDFDRFWNGAVSEMKAVDPRIILSPSDFKVSFADCYDLSFTGVGGSRLHAKYLKPKNAPQPHPAVVLFHGYGSNSGDWSDKLSYVGLGFSVAALDCRGQGGLSQDTGVTTGTTYHGHIVRGLDDPPEKLLFRSHFLDTAQLAGIMMNMPEVDENRVGAMGGSQGGALAFACAALEPRIKRLVSYYPFLSDFKRVWDMDLAVNSYEEIKTYFRRFDPLHKRETEIFTKLGYIDIRNLAGRIRARVLMAAGLMDPYCPPSTQFAAYNLIRSEKEMTVYPDFGHELLPGFLDSAFAFLSGL